MHFSPASLELFGAFRIVNRQKDALKEYLLRLLNLIHRLGDSQHIGDDGVTYISRCLLKPALNRQYQQDNASDFEVVKWSIIRIFIIVPPVCRFTGLQAYRHAVSASLPREVKGDGNTNQCSYLVISLSGWLEPKFPGCFGGRFNESIYFTIRTRRLRLDSE